MTPLSSNQRAAKIGAAIRQARAQAGLTTRQVGAAVGVSHSYIAKIEHGWYASLDPHLLNRLAKALDVPAADLFTAAGYRLPEQLPTIGPYLRSRYGDELPDQAIDQLTEYFDLLRTKYQRGEGDDEHEERRDAAGSRR